MTGQRAVIWDYDGTLVDTREKNLRVNRRLITTVSGRPLEDFPALATTEAYAAANRRTANWRELYGREFGLSDELVDEAGRLWSSYQLLDRTPAPFFGGVAEAMASMKDLTQVVFSQNSRDTILQALEAVGLSGYITLVVGYEEVSFGRQKPAPDGLLLCLEEISMAQGTVFYVGDHDTDVELARRANVALQQSQKELRVVSVGAEFTDKNQGTWALEPDYVARRPVEVAELVIAGSEW